MARTSEKNALNRIPKLLYQYKAKGRRCQVCPTK